MPESTLMPESPSRVERRRARNRDALVTAARGLFAREGFEAATVAGITGAADLGFGTFYRYFEDKEAVLEAVLEEGRLEIDAVLLEDDSGVPAHDALTAVTRRFVQAVRTNHDVLALMWQVAMRETKGRRPLRIDRGDPERSLPARLSAAMRNIIERGMRASEFSPGDPLLVSRFLAGAHMYLLSPTAQDLDEATIVEALCEFELRALGAVQTDARAMRTARGREL